MFSLHRISSAHLLFITVFRQENKTDKGRSSKTPADVKGKGKDKEIPNPSQELEHGGLDSTNPNPDVEMHDVEDVKVVE